MSFVSCRLRPSAQLLDEEFHFDPEEHVVLEAYGSDDGNMLLKIGRQDGQSFVDRPIRENWLWFYGNTKKSNKLYEMHKVSMPKLTGEKEGGNHIDHHT